MRKIHIDEEEWAARKLRLSTMQIVALGFMGIILAGGLLLWLPFSNRQPISFLDALFTAVTCVCVTGLVTVVPATQFTLIGKGIMLVLIQIGGLGVIACTSAFFLLLRKKISFRGRQMISQSYGLDTMSGMVKFIIRVLKGTFTVEAIGAVFYSIRFVQDYGVVKGVGYGIFHSVSAFCNAGVDLLGSNSLIGYAGSPLINFTTILLIVVSGLGFPVWYDILGNIKKAVRERGTRPLKWLFTRLELQSKVVLVMTGFLILFGTVLFFLLEYSNPATMGEFSVTKKLMASLFQSVTTRTAGFAAVSQSALRPGSRLLGCLLMFIGGSPTGTAGGIKTTAAMLVLTVISVLRGRKDTECFNRKIDETVVRSGITISLVTFFFWMSGVTVLTILEPGQDFLNLMYEVTSAMATVGLTADLTPSLCRASHVVLMILMYIGRIGPVTMALVFAGRAERTTHFRSLPEGRIMIG